METFNGENNLTVDHIDGNKLNNRLENLQYLTLEDNVRKSSIGKIPWNKTKVNAIVDGDEYRFDSVYEFCNYFDIRKLQISN